MQANEDMEHRLGFCVGFLFKNSVLQTVKTATEALKLLNKSKTILLAKDHFLRLRKIKTTIEIKCYNL